MFMISAIARAFTSKLSKISASESENRRLQAAGISDPTVQAYFLWRRSLVSVVVLATILSAGLATYRNWTEDDDEEDVISIQIEKMLNHAKSKMPAAPGLLKVAENQIAAAAEEMEEEDDEADKPAADSAKETSDNEDPKKGDDILDSSWAF